MSRPPLTKNEEARLASLHRYTLLDTPHEPAFDRLASLAARLFQVPLALVTLIDRDRQWFKSCQGRAAGSLALLETHRDIAFCAYTILANETLVAEDLSLDQRFADNPLVTGAPSVRFYAGAPLITAEGHALGSLCLIDFQPRTFSEDQRRMLTDLAAGVVSEIELRRALATLTTGERLYRRMFEDSPHPMWVFDKNTLRFLDVNETALVRYGYERAQFLALKLPDILLPEDWPRLHESLPSLEMQVGDKRLWQHRKKDGTLIWADIAAHAMEYQGHAACLVAAYDVTERRQAEEALRLSEARKAAILEAALDCIISIDHQHRILEWNPSAEKTFGYSRAEALGQDMVALIVPSDFQEAHHRGIAHYLATGEGPVLDKRVEVIARRKDGSEFPAELTATVIQTDGEPTFTAYLRDISAQKALEAEREGLLAQTEALLAIALERADHDPLTGLLNHRAFHKRLKEEAERATRQDQALSLLLIDLDNFKFFNDSYGHPSGDAVLGQLAQALLSCARPQDTPARFGGDEFVLLMPGAARDEAAQMAERLHTAVARVGYRPPGYDTPIPLSLCLGLAVLPEDGRTPAALLETADAQLRVAKSGGDTNAQAMRLRRTMAHSVEGFSMLDALVTAVDNKDRYTRKHSEDVLLYSVAIARELGWDDNRLHTVEVAALLHDVGKIGVPDSILRKPGVLTPEDYQAIQQHPLMGAIIVGAVPGFEEALDAVRHHHERWDGDGYPFGLRGEETPLMARLMAVADAYSAMTTDRPYRKGMAPAKARRILQEGAGTQWDPDCAAAFLRAVA